jgi:hypothetical protein
MWGFIFSIGNIHLDLAFSKIKGEANKPTTKTHGIVLACYARCFIFTVQRRTVPCGVRTAPFVRSCCGAVRRLLVSFPARVSYGVRTESKPHARCTKRPPLVRYCILRIIIPQFLLGSSWELQCRHQLRTPPPPINAVQGNSLQQGSDSVFAFRRRRRWPRTGRWGRRARAPRRDTA